MKRLFIPLRRQTVLSLQQGWMLTILPIAFRHPSSGPSIEDVDQDRTVGEGGDTDTNGGICGVLLGAAQGSAAIPVRWSMAVLACRPMAESGAKKPRPARYWPDDVAVLAEGLVGRGRR